MVGGFPASAGRLFSGAGFSALGSARLPHAVPALDAARAKISASNDWQITDLYKNGEQEPSIIFSEEAIEETTVQLLGPAYRVEEPDDGQDADAVMQAAEAHMYQNPLQGLMPVLSSMLRDPEIQRATISHLRRNPEFHRYMLASSATSSAPLAIELPESFSQAEEAPAGLQGLIEDLASKIKAAGEAALQKAAGFRIALGRLLIHLGANLHAFLGQPFSRAPLEENLSQEELDERADMIGQALTTVAVAILSIVFLKRAHLISAL